MDLFPEALKTNILNTLSNSTCYLLSDEAGIKKHQFTGVYIVSEGKTPLQTAPGSIANNASESCIIFIGMSTTPKKSVAFRVNEYRKMVQAGGRVPLMFYTTLPTAAISAPSIELMLIDHYKPSGNIQKDQLSSGDSNIVLEMTTVQTTAAVAAAVVPQVPAAAVPQVPPAAIPVQPHVAPPGLGDVPEKKGQGKRPPSPTEEENPTKKLREDSQDTTKKEIPKEVLEKVGQIVDDELAKHFKDLDTLAVFDKDKVYSRIALEIPKFPLQDLKRKAQVRMNPKLSGYLLQKTLREAVVNKLKGKPVPTSHEEVGPFIDQLVKEFREIPGNDKLPIATAKETVENKRRELAEAGRQEAAAEEARRQQGQKGFFGLF